MTVEKIVRLVCSRCGATGQEDVSNFFDEEHSYYAYHRAKVVAQKEGWYTEERGNELCPECKLDMLVIHLIENDKGKDKEK